MAKTSMPMFKLHCRSHACQGVPICQWYTGAFCLPWGSPAVNSPLPCLLVNQVEI